MANQPNIVLILADDMGYGDLSCLNEQGKIHTPHMDRLATQGMTFTDGHAASAVCTPSRYSILTGRYAWRSALQRAVLGPLGRPLIEADRPTLPGFLRDQGYHTACVGKWHLGMNWPLSEDKQQQLRKIEEQPGHPWKDMCPFCDDVDYSQPIQDGPMDRGFDEYFGVDVPNFPPYCYIEGRHTIGSPTTPKPDDMFGLPGPMVEGWDLQAILPDLADRAVKVVEQGADRDEPFFLYMPLTAPHTPIEPTPEFQGKSEAGVYGDFVMQVDHTVGLVVEALERTGQADNTVVIVTSDNGSPGRNGSTEAPGTCTEMFGHTPNWILRGMKGDSWDGGHRIPLIVRWPGHIEDGATCDQLVCLMDLFATTAAILDTPVPEGAAEDSVNLLPYLLGETPDQPLRRELVHHSLAGHFGIRRDQWKLITNNASGGFSPSPPVSAFAPAGQLYDMASDIREQDNRYAEMPEVVRELSHLLADHL